MQQFIDHLYYSLAPGKHLMFFYLLLSCSIGLPSLVVILLAQMKSHWKALTYLTYFLLAKTSELVFVSYIGYQYANILIGFHTYQLIIVFSLESFTILLVPLLMNEWYGISRRRSINGVFGVLCGIGLALIIIPYLGGVYGRHGSSTLLQEGILITSLISFKVYRLLFWGAQLYAFIIGLIHIKNIADQTERNFNIQFTALLLIISCHPLVSVVIKTFPENVFILAGGYFFLNILLLKYLFRKFLAPTPPILKENLERLISNREKEVFLLLVEGLSNKDIGQKLYITEATVKSHIKSIYKKLQIRNRLQLLNLVKNS